MGIKVAELADFPNDVIVEASALLEKFERGGLNEKDIVVSEEDYEKQRLLKVKKVIDNTDFNSITPLEALNILHRLKSDNRS